MTKQTIICGISGGIGSGKSYIAEQFHLLGAAVFDADRAGHRVLKRSDVKARLIDQWGREILDGDAEIDRSKVAALIFTQNIQGQKDRDFLQSLSHPFIKRELELFIARTESEIVIVDAALLLETGWQSVCSQIIFVDAVEDLRLQRCQQRGWSEDQFRAREATQWSIQRKRSQASFVIDNNGDSQRTVKEIEKVWQALSLLVGERV
tara:strand:+ start:2681 stop:3301 length:621 start_codon:yes stop_codon:yes gene_type:complete